MLSRDFRFRSYTRNSLDDDVPSSSQIEREREREGGGRGGGNRMIVFRVKIQGHVLLIDCSSIL